jgi:hypothetical protein
MFKVGGTEFRSFVQAVRFANRRKLDVLESREDGTLFVRWSPNK